MLAIIGIILAIVGLGGTIWANNYSAEDLLEDVFTYYATGKTSRPEAVKFFNDYGIIMIIVGVLLIIVGVVLSKNKNSGRTKSYYNPYAAMSRISNAQEGNKPSPSRTVYCPNCGQQLRQQDKFCPSCGQYR